MLRIAAVFGVLLSLSSAAPADDKKEAPKVDEKLLAGKWKLVKISAGNLPDGAEITLDVKKDGKFTLTMSGGGQKDVNEATWKLDGNKFSMEFTEGSRKGMKETDTVKELTAKKLVLVDEKDTTEEWEKVPEKKEKGDK